MHMVQVPGTRPVRMGDLRAEMTKAANGTIYVRSAQPLPDYPRSIIDCLRRWAQEAPDRLFLADRGAGGAWRKVTYAQALEKTRAIAQHLLDRDLSADRPIAILSGNGLEHAFMALGAMMAGIPYAPVSPAYSLISTDFAKLKHIFGLVTPGLVFTTDGKPFENALKAVMTPDMELICVRDPVSGYETRLFDEIATTMPTDAVEAADAAVTPDTVAKFLFTSGSTGMPKAVINTQRMLTCNQVMLAEAYPFFRDEPPVLVDWLPWNHTAGGNHNFGITLYNGGSLYIDDGKPTPDGIARTVRNLTEIAPTIYFNVPKGYEMLCEHFDRNAELRANFFSRVKFLQYAGAGLSQHVWDTLERLALETVGEKIMIITGYGSTETAPFAFTTTWAVEQAGSVGLPAAGLEVKLVPNEGKCELRLRGPSITPGYWRQPDKTAECFDDEGYYCIGDALKFVEDEDVSRGFLFDGRVSEDFKLSTGTWVDMAGVRSAIVRTFAPYVRDVVLTGLNRDHIGAMLFLDPDAARKIADDIDPHADEVTLARHPRLRAVFQERLDAMAQKSTGSSNFVARALVLEQPPSIDAHELTDKGSINQRAVIAARAGLFEDLYAEPVPDHVLVARKKS